MKAKKNTKKICLRILLFLSILCIIGGTFFAAYHFVSKKNSSTYTFLLKEQKTAIDNANNSAAAAIEKLSSTDASDTDTISEITSALKESESAVKKAISETNDITIPAKYQDQLTKLLEGMSLNRKIYTQSILIVKNPTSPDLTEALSDLDIYITDAATAYYSGTINDIYIELPNEILTLKDSVETYAEDLYNEHQAKMAILQENQEYYDAMESIVKDFQNNMTDLSQSYKKLSNGNSSVSEMYTEIEKKLQTLAKINNIYGSISVPSQATASPSAAEVHKSFNSLLASYITYCQGYESAILNYGQAGNDETKLSECKVSFENLNKDYINISDANTSFYSSFMDSRDHNIDINNL